MSAAGEMFLLSDDGSGLSCTSIMDDDASEEFSAASRGTEVPAIQI